MKLLSKIKELYDKVRACRYRKTVYFIAYTVLFGICAAALLSHFVLRDKSLIWSANAGNWDGISQHYIALSYWGDYLRNVARTLFTEGRLVFPLYDTSIGMGSDVLQTLGYYVIGDPLTLLSALVPRAHTETLYNVLIIFRLYLAGLAFSAFAMTLKKNNRFFTLIASLVYLFSGYTLFAAVRHPYFSNPMIYFPLILIGVEYIFRGKKPWLFILSVTLAAMSNFYFFYMICILTVLYVLIRLFDYAPKGERKKMVGYLIRFAVFAVLAVMMAAVLFYPALRTTLSSSRQQGGSSVPLLYNWRYYEKYIFSAVTAAGQGDWDFHGHLPLSLIAIFLLWATPQKSKTERRLFVLCTVMLAVPVFGWLLNGMAYVANRWCWGYSLLVACICAFRLPKLLTISRKKWLVLLGFAVLFAVGASYFRLTGEYYRTGVIGVLCTAALTAGVCLCVTDKHKKEHLLRASLLFLAVVQVCEFCTARMKAGEYAEQFISSGQALSNAREAQGAALSDLGDTSYYRYEDHFGGDTSRQKNAALLNGGHSTNCYFSLSSDAWFEQQRSLGHSDTMVQLMTGLDNRTIQGTLANVKYFTTTAQGEGYLPYRYDKEPVMTREIKNSRLYRTDATASTKKTNYFGYYVNENALPFGYTYSSYITKEEYDSLNYADRQRVMLHNAVLEENSSFLPKGTLPDKTESSEIKITTDPTIVREGDVFTANKAGMFYIELPSAQAKRETYLSFTLESFEQFDPLTRAEKNGTLETATPLKLKDLKRSTRNFTPDDTVLLDIFMRCGEVATQKSVEFFTPANSYYAAVHDFNINMGYFEGAPTRIAVSLPSAGKYVIKNIAVTQLSFDGYEVACDALAKEHLENVVFSDNKISGSITVSENKLLCLSLPYSPGFTAFVDGKEVEIKKTDLAFMGIELTQGEHTVELRYFTPFLAFGILVSAVGWSIFVIWVICDKIKSNKKGKKERI